MLHMWYYPRNHAPRVLLHLSLFVCGTPRSYGLYVVLHLLLCFMCGTAPIATCGTPGVPVQLKNVSVPLYWIYFKSKFKDAEYMEHTVYLYGCVFFLV